MKTVAFVIPGYHHSPDRKIYTDIIDGFEEKKFKVIPVKISWQYHTMSFWVEEFLKIYDIEKGDINIFLGFSYGAMISFIASTQVKVDTQILCSLSPYFAEDLEFLPRLWKKGKRRIADFKTISASIRTPQIKADTYVLYGSKESKQIEKRAKDVFALLTSSKHIIQIKDSKHDIGNPDYLFEIRKIIAQL